MIPAVVATPSTSPFAAVPSLIAWKTSLFTKILPWATASLAVSHAVLLLLGAAVALRGPADLHKSLRQQVDFEVVPTAHHADGAQLDTGKCRVGYKGKKERNGVPEMIPSS